MSDLAAATTPLPYNATTSADPNEAQSDRGWSRTTTAAFRFCLVYFGLYVLMTQMLSSLVTLPVINLPELGAMPPFRGLFLWVGNTLFGVKHPIAWQNTGSGDRSFDFVQVITLLIVSAIVTAVWSYRARSAARDARIYPWFRLFMRLSLATSMLSYGFVKLVPLQMPFQLRRLVEPYGNFSLMGVLWSSIGFSYPYEIFVGGAECLGGILLFFPRTATLGALICLADVVEVFMLNMTYDVPVKLFSFHLILFSLVLLAPNLRRLLDLFVFGRGTQLAGEPMLGRTVEANRKATRWQWIFGVYVVAVSIYGSAKSWSGYGGGAPKSPLYGIWTVDRMIVDGVEKPALVTDTTRYRHAIFQQPTNATFQRMNDNFRGFALTLDTTARTMTLTGPPAQKAAGGVLDYQRPSKDRLVLDGTLDRQRVHMELSWRDPDSFQVRSRRFNLVSEFPFNR